MGYAAKLADRMNTRFLNPTRALYSLLAVCSLLALPGARLDAQRVLGSDMAGDAVTIPRGTLRVSIGGEHTIQRDRWRDGTLEPLGAGFSFTSLGPAQLAVLGPMQQSIRDLGVADFSASLGTTDLDLRQRIFVTPFSVELGVTEWLTFGVTAPLVRSRSEANFTIDGTNATVGLNPFFLGSAVPTANRTTIDRFTSAASSLTARRNACLANAAAFPDCPTIIAEAAQVNALISGTSTFAGRLRATYGALGGPTPAAYVPLAGSAAALALRARVDSLRAAFTRYGVGDITAATGLPLGAQAPLAAGDLARLVRDSVSGYGARELSGSARINIGDVDVDMKLKLFDSFGGRGASATDARLTANRFGIRQSVGATFRLGSGTPGAPGDFLDLGTGTGENAVGVRSYTDVVLNSRLWSTFVLGWSQALGEIAVIRVPSVMGDQLLESWREVLAPVTHGSVIQIEAAPRYQLNDYFGVGGYWGYRQRSADRYTVLSMAGAVPAAAGIVTLDLPGMLSANASTEQRAGFSVVFSTLAAKAQGRVPAGFELVWSHQQSVTSGEGIVPKRWEDRLQIRYYTRLFGR